MHNNTTDATWDALARLAHRIEQLRNHARVAYPNDARLRELTELLDREGGAVAEALAAPPAPFPEPRCDTCGRWDSALRQGLCADYQRRYRPASLRERACDDDYAVRTAVRVGFDHFPHAVTTGGAA